MTLDNKSRLERLQAERRSDVSMGERARRFFEALQQRICKEIEAEDGGVSFRRDEWNRPGGGGGDTRVIEGGEVFEKGGVNTSAVFGDLPERMAKVLGVAASPFFATGISLVIHPRSPMVPTVHANFRYFALGDDPFNPTDQWFGGGADLTPCYPFLKDVQHFHGVWKSVCDRHEVADYGQLKRACDEYFYLPHRGEARGVGGIFFDYLREDPEASFFFVRDAGRAFLSSYVPIVARRKDLPFEERHREFQAVRRGRYVEFNLVYDRGTKFGLETGGRTESILMSLPPVARWRYDFKPEPNTPEDRAARFFGRHDWLALPADAPGFDVFGP